MIKKLYVNNFRSLVNLSMDFSAMNFLLGPNGGGKSTVFDALMRLREFSTGNKSLQDAFPSHDCTRWVSATPIVQSFELGLETPHGEYTYQLKLEQNTAISKARVVFEHLALGDTPLFHFDIASADGYAQLYKDGGIQGPHYPMDWSRSGVGSLYERHDNQGLSNFKKCMAQLIILRLNPFGIDDSGDEDDQSLDHDGGNFANWFSALKKSVANRTLAKLEEKLSEIFPGFDTLKSLPSAQGHTLYASFEGDRQGTNGYKLSELSEGQRALIVLYTILTCIPNGQTVCIDEPENFLALPEIQPWIDAFWDRAELDHIQLLVISHHPRLVNMLVRTNAIWLSRDGGNAPTRQQKIEISSDDQQVKPAVLMERGWLVDG